MSMHNSRQLIKNGYSNFTTSNCVGIHNSEYRRRNRILNYIHDSTHESTGMHGTHSANFS